MVDWQRKLCVSKGTVLQIFNLIKKESDEECYCCIDNHCGVEAIGFNSFNLAGVSRAGKATIIDEAKYIEFQRRVAMKLRIDLQGPN